MKPVCLVIGAGAGIGGNVARRFAREGYHACLCRRSDLDGLNRMVHTIKNDGGSATGSSSVIWASRVQLDFWDPENGYYLNGTYYGDKNLLALGGATEVQDFKTATTVDFLLERKIMGGGAFTIESEYSRYNRLGGYDGNYLRSEGGYGLASVVFPKAIGPGKVEALGKFAEAEFTGGLVHTLNPSYRQKTTDVEIGYIIKQFDARLFAFGKNTSFNAVQKNNWDAGLGMQLQLSKQILGPK